MYQKMYVDQGNQMGLQYLNQLLGQNISQETI